MAGQIRILARPTPNLSGKAYSKTRQSPTLLARLHHKVLNAARRHSPPWRIATRVWIEPRSGEGSALPCITVPLVACTSFTHGKAGADKNLRSLQPKKS